MTGFWILAALMTAVALAFVLVPLLDARVRAGPSTVDANLEVLRGQRREIDADVASGLLAAGARDEALAELVDRAGSDLAAANASVPLARAGRPWVAAGVVAITLPATAFAVYLALGTPSAIDAAKAAAPAAALEDQQILAMVESLAAKVRARPDDVQGWTLLARSMAALGRFKEAAQAYEHLATLAPRDADVLADYADALGMAQGRTLAGRPYELAKQALAIDPRHRKALALAGTAAMDANDFPAALERWQLLAAQLPADSEDERQVRNIIAEVRVKATAAGKALPSSPAPAKAPVAAAQGSVSGLVSLAPALAAKVSGDATLFVFARAESGSRMPLAVLRKSVSELPLRFALDDSLAMTPAARISSADALHIEARISRSGNALPQAGDLVGASGIVKPGARDISVVIDKVVP